MSRSGYVDDGETWALVCWRGAVKSSIKGKRGQQFLQELAEAMDAMPEKRLISGELEQSGEFCTLGVIGNARGVDLSGIDPEDSDQVSSTFDIANALAREIVYENDEGFYMDETPEQRWWRMRKWVSANLIDEAQQCPALPEPE